MSNSIRSPRKKIQVEEKKEEDNSRTRADLKNTSKGGDDDDNDNDKDNGFFGDWVEGYWCYLLSKHDDNNNNGDGTDADSVDTSRQIRHRKNNYDN